MEKLFYPVNQRRLRANPHIRSLTASVKLSSEGFIQPLFVEEGLSGSRSIPGMGSIEVETGETVFRFVEASLKEGMHRFLLFPVPEKKTTDGFNFGFASELVQRLKEQFGPDIWLAVDLCLCSYTTHGHCGILTKDQQRLDNHKSVEVLSRYASLLAQAGADCIAPSDMMDGRISAIRQLLDALQFDDVSIMSYSAKFSSVWYGPFRDACHSSPNAVHLKDRKTYQISPLHPQDALASSLRDEKEGADILMVKPAGLYTDIISSLKQKTMKPVAAYHVSGEYASIELMSNQGLLKREAAHLEVWAALQRSGADIIISYAAREAKKLIENYQY